MQSFIEPLYKSDSKIQFGWTPEPVSNVASYKIYVGLVGLPGSLSLLVSNINPQASQSPVSLGKVAYDVTASSVQAVLGLSSTSDFSNTVFYFAITYVDTAGTESALADSRIVEVPPVGIMSKLRKEDPTANRHVFGFSDELQRWVKIMTSGKGGLITDPSDFYKANITTEYTYDGSGNVLTTKSYLSDMTMSGAPAKLTTYEYSGGNVSKIIIADSTV